MGNILEIDLSKYGCTCFNQEDKDYLDFFEDIKNKTEPALYSEKIKNKTENSTLVTTNKKYEKITYIPKEKNDIEKENSLFNNKNYLKEFDFSYTEMNITNNNFTDNRINESKTKTKNEEYEYIYNYNLNTD